MGEHSNMATFPLSVAKGKRIRGMVVDYSVEK